MKLYTSTLILIFFIFGHNELFSNYAEITEYKKTISERFQLNTNTPEITIDNRYGNIDVIATSNQEALVNVTIVAEARNEKRANEIFEKIDIEFKSGSDFVNASTVINANKGWNWTKKNEHYKIHYEIHIPNTSRIEMSNKYGDISMGEHEGQVSINIKYGSYTIQSVAGNLMLEAKYAEKVSIGSIRGDLELESSYSNIHLTESQSLTGQSKYSRFYIERLGDLNLSTKYDHYDIHEVGMLDVDGKYNDLKIGTLASGNFAVSYSNIKIDQLKTAADFNTKYGGVSIENVSNIAKRIKIESNYTNYKLSSTSNPSLDLDLKHVSVNYPDNLDISYRNRDSNSLQLKANSKAGSGVQIIAKMKYGSLNIAN